MKIIPKKMAARVPLDWGYEPVTLEADVCVCMCALCGCVCVCVMYCIACPARKTNYDFDASQRAVVVAKLNEKIQEHLIEVH